MKFNTCLSMIATLSLLDMTAAMIRRYANDSTLVVPTLSGTGWSNWEPMPTLRPTNSTSAIAPVTSSQVFEITSTVVGSTTLSYILGPQGGSSVVTTVVENTSTITMTTTMYLTLTMTTPEGPASSNVDNNPSESTEPTVTITDYQTMTKTITMQNVETGGGSGAAALDGGSSLDTANTEPGAGSGPGSFFASNVSSMTVSGNLFGTSDGACGVITVTSTIVEKSTVTVTPTSTEISSIQPTASPPYGYGNGTDSTVGFPTASSGWLTFYKRSQPTKM